MSSINSKLQNVRTIEDIVNLLSILFTNLNNQNEIYYDMFLNPVPMDLELERYDENGQLVTVTIPNRAKDVLATYSGEGNPNGVISASPGALYIDTAPGSSYSMYYKGYGTDSYGWILIWSVSNLDYLSPTGDGSNLTNLNASNITTGTLSVLRGGTGQNSLTGILKGNGTSPVTSAIRGVDYLGPEALDSVANVDLSNLSAQGQNILDAKANVDLSNLSAEGEAVLSGKADVDLSNLSAEGEAVLDAKANTDFSNVDPGQIFKVSSISWGMPDYARAYSAGTSGTAATNGYLYAYANIREGATSAVIYIDGTGIVINGFLTNREGGHGPGLVVPIAKNSTYSRSGSYYAFNFIPCKGES